VTSAGLPMSCRAPGKRSFPAGQRDSAFLFLMGSNSFDAIALLLPSQASGFALFTLKVWCGSIKSFYEG
jgi:hypothetical protein